MRLYKLTDGKAETRNNTRWGEGVSHSGTGEGGLCGKGYIHAYEDPNLAVLLNPIHGDFKNPRLWEAEGDVALRDGQLKCGCVTLTTVREIPVPAVSAEQRVAFAILCALEVCRDAAFAKWAAAWLDGSDRSEAAAARTAAAAAEAERAAEAWTAVAAAGSAAWAAATSAAMAEAAASAAAWAAWAEEAAGAEEAARAAREAAGSAARGARADIDLAAIAKKAMENGNR